MSYLARRLRTSVTSGASVAVVASLLVAAAPSAIAGAGSVVSGQVQADTNGDASGDVPMGGVTVQVLSGTTVVATAKTSGLGVYTFTDLSDGTYTLRQSVPVGFAAVSSAALSVTVAGATTSTENNFVDHAVYAVSGTVNEDTTGDGTGDRGLSGVAVRLRNADGVVVRDTTTNGSGEYNFANVPIGTYTVEESDPAGLISVSDSDGADPNSIPITLASPTQPEPTAAEGTPEFTAELAAFSSAGCSVDYTPAATLTNAVSMANFDAGLPASEVVDGTNVNMVASGGTTSSQTVSNIPILTWNINSSAYQTMSFTYSPALQTPLSFSMYDIDGNVETMRVEAFDTSNAPINMSGVISLGSNLTFINGSSNEIQPRATSSPSSFETNAENAAIVTLPSGVARLVVSARENLVGGRNFGISNPSWSSTTTTPSSLSIYCPNASTGHDFVDTAPTDAALTITKSASVVDANANGRTDLGDHISYSFLVRNTGAVTLTGVAVADPSAGATSCSETVLAPGVSTLCTANAMHAITQSDVDAGVVANTATVSGMDPGGRTVAGEAPSSTLTSIPQNPALTATSTATINDTNNNGTTDPGDNITYTTTITNTGTVTLTTIQTTNTLNHTTTCTPTELTPSQTATCTTTPHPITQTDIDTGLITQTTTATATTTTNPTTTIQSNPTTTDTPLPQNPALAITQSRSTNDPDGNGLDVGDSMTLTFTATNTGNVTLDDVSVRDSKVGVVSCIPSRLAPGLSATCVSSPYTFTPGDMSSGEIINNATASASGPKGSVTSNPTSESISLFTIAAAVEPWPPVNGATGAQTTTLLGADRVNGSPASAEEVSVRIDQISKELSFNATTNTVTVPPGTPAGNYSVEYTVCMIADNLRCASVTETIVVLRVDAVTGPVTMVDSSTPTTISVWANDALNGQPATGATVIGHVNAISPELEFDPATGVLTVPVGTAPGTYSVTYTICAASAPTVCDTTTESLTVHKIDAVAENPWTFTSPMGGSTSFILASDTLDGAPVTLRAVELTVEQMDPHLSYDPLSGVISVQPNTPPGTYTMDYTIAPAAASPAAKVGSPASRTATALFGTLSELSDSATETVIVTNATLSAVNDIGTGAPGTAVTIDVVANDTGRLDRSSVRLTDPATGQAVSRLVVPGEGTWTVNPDTGEITFTPEPGFGGNPTPVTYRVSDQDGNVTTGRVTVTYTPISPRPAPPGTSAPGPRQKPLPVTGAVMPLGIALSALALLLLGAVGVRRGTRQSHR